MSEHTAPINSAKLLLPVVIFGMLVLMIIMFKFGGNAGVAGHSASGGAAAHSTDTGH